MSEVNVTKCDGCGKRVADHYLEIGWLQITASSTGPVSIARAAGRKKDGCGKTDYLQRVKDFCSIECLKDALDREAAKRSAEKCEHCGREGK